MTVGELCERMTFAEFQYWQAREQRKPLPDSWLQSSVQVLPHLKKGKTLSDVYPFLKRKQPKKKLTKGLAYLDELAERGNAGDSWHN